MPVAPTMIGVIYTLFKFQSVLISSDRYVYARIFWRRLLHVLLSFGTATSIKLAVLLILSTTNMSGLFLITSWSVWFGNFHRIFFELFSTTYLRWLVLVPWYVFFDQSMLQQQENMNVFTDVIMAFEIFCR